MTKAWVCSGRRRGAGSHLVELKEPLVEVARVGEFAGQLSAGAAASFDEKLQNSARMPVPFGRGTKRDAAAQYQRKPLRSALY